MKPQRIAFALLVGLLGLGAAAQAEEEIRLALSPTLSPDGKALVFSWRGDLWRAPTTGGAAQRLTFHPATDTTPRFSCDGERIAFASERSGSRQVWILPAGGGLPVQATRHSEGSVALDWFPGDEALLTWGARDHFWRRPERFFVRRIEGDAPPVLLFDAYGSAGRLSPDGRRLLFVREGTAWWRRAYRGSQAAQIWLFDTATGGFTRISRDDHEERWPLWLPDGSGFLFVREENGVANLWSHDLATGVRARLTVFEEDGIDFPALSRDGSTVVFRRLFDLYRFDPRGGGEPQRIRLVHTGDPVVERLHRDELTTAAQAAFSDDGREIVFAAGGDLWVMDTELREPVRLTDTPEEERDPVFSPDFSSIVFVSDKGGQPDLWSLARGDPQQPWWRNRAFAWSQLTNDADAEWEPNFTPDGRIAFTARRGDLWTMAPDGTDTKVILESWNPPSYSFSPDGKWLAYAVDDEDFNRDVWIRPADGTGEPVNVSRHPDEERNPVWSPDGKLLAFTGERAHRERDIHYVWLRKEDDDRTKRDRTLEKALDKMKERKEPKVEKPDRPRIGAALLRMLGFRLEKEQQGKPGRGKKKDEPEKVEVRIDFEGIHDRVRRISLPDTSESGLMFSPDGKKLAFRAEIEGRQGLWTVEFPDEFKPKLLTGAAGSGGRWLKEGDRIVWLLQGRPASVSGAGKAESYPFRTWQAVDLRRRHLAAFDQAWRVLRDNWYDARLNNRDWDAMLAKYRPAAAECATADELDQVASMLMGELNGSHLGFWASDPGPGSGQEWSETTAHLGVRFDREWTGPGLRIRDVVKESPAWRDVSRLRPGEILLAVDGRELNPSVDWTALFTGAPEREMELRVRDAKGEERTVRIQPTTYREVRRRLYDAWVEANRMRVDELSGGTLGYVHVRGMSWPSFERFEAELYKVGHGKQGLLIDVRENGGGFTADHLLTCLCQPEHAWTVARGGSPGYPQDRMVYARWSKPIVVLCNQNSFSNAEIFAHAVKTLKRGRIVGVPTAGGVISTGGTSILGFAGIRLPTRGWFVLDSGEDMERMGCVPDVTLWPEPGELPRGVDRQLEKAVELLREDVAAWQARARPRLRYASEREE